MLALAGCGDDGDSPGSDLADLAPPKTVVFVEGALRPKGALRSNVDSVTRQITGVDNLGDLIISELEGSVSSLGGTSVIGFADGPASLRLADAFIPASDADFEQAKRFLRSIRFLALGSSLENDPATLKLIAGLRG